MNQDHEAEVITAVCKNKDISALFAEGVDEMFLTHGDVWAALKSYYFKYKTVPDVEVLKERYEDFQIPEVKGNTEYYVERMRDEFIKNKVKSILLAGNNSLKGDSPERALEKIQADLASLNKYTASIKDLDLTDFAAAEKHYDIVRQKSAMMGGSPGIPFGFRAMDLAVPTGMAPGHLIVIIGWPAKGKTWFSIKLAENAWRRGFKPMIISAEMSAANMRDRVYTVMGQGTFRADDLVRGNVNADDLRAFGKKITEDRDSFIVISPEGLTDITPQIIQSKIDIHKPDLLIVDYHQLLMDNRRTEQMTPRAMNLSRELKMLATSNNIPVIDITAATSEETSDRNDPPMMSQVAWSKAIEYDADLAIAVHRTEGPDGWDAIEIASRKVRHGREFGLFLEWNLSTGEIRETYN
jgi:replicative DNA helicase